MRVYTGCIKLVLYEHTGIFSNKLVYDGDCNENFVEAARQYALQ